MPEWFERQLTKEVRKKHLKGKSKVAYIYGSKRRIGWKPKQHKGTVKRANRYRR
jgi:hypothetical protein